MSSWRKCSSCKKDIGFASPYYVCSVSTCQAKATNYAFCSVPCWDAHVPIERHRSSQIGAVEKRSPSSAEAETAAAPRRIVASAPGATKPDDSDVLVVASKVRKYIFDRSGMNTSASAYDALSEKIRLLCDLAIDNARRDGRKTVMDRDV